MDRYMKTTVGVLGLGKLGLPLALVLAEAGHRVLCWDVTEAVRTSVKNGTPHIEEPLVTELMRVHKLEVVPPSFIAEMASVVFVIVPTPSTDADGSFDDSYVRDAIKSLGGQRGQGPVVACVSTLSPGSSRKLAQMCRDQNMAYVYSPTMIALGSVIHDLREAEMQIIGVASNTDDRYDDSAAARVALTWRTVANNTPHVIMSYESAEVCKIASNTFSTMKIAFFNELGHMCHNIPGANVDDVSDGLRLRTHVGTKLTVAGAGFGGPCFPRDTHAFAALSHGGLGNVIHTYNTWHITDIATLGPVTHARTYAVMGRNYKDGANLQIESFGDQLADTLETFGLQAAHAPDADIVYISMPLRGINLCDSIKQGATVIDVWRTHSYLRNCNCTYIPFGIGEELIK